MDPHIVAYADGGWLETIQAMPLIEAFLGTNPGTTAKIRKSLLSPELPLTPIMRRALSRPAPEKGVGVFEVDDELYAVGYGYYLGLLAFRKRFGKVISDELRYANGHEATPKEWQDAC